MRRRWVQTERFIAERAAGRGLTGRYRNRYTDDLSLRGRCRSSANTNVVVHNGVLLALKEDSLPYALNPHTLDTVGRWDFGGQLADAPFTAHPKFDPVSGTMIAFGYQAKGDATRDIVVYEFDRTGRKLWEAWIEAPFAGMIHDCGVTQNYIIFPLIPLTTDLAILKDGGPHFQWQPGMDQYYGVMPRGGEARDVRWFRAPNGFQGHTVNAFDDGGLIHIDLPVADDNVFPFFPNLADPKPFGPLTVAMTRWTIDPAAGTDRLEPAILSPLCGEFPRIDPRYETLPYRHTILIGRDPDRPYDAERLGPPNTFFFNTINHLDVATGRHSAWFADDTSTFQEPVFVPRRADAAEGDGYALVLVNRLAEGVTDLVVLDALHLADGPIATIRLPIRHRMGLHGNWAPSSQLPPT